MYLKHVRKSRSQEASAETEVAVATTEAVATTGEETGNIQYLTKKKFQDFLDFFLWGNGEVYKERKFISPFLHIFIFQSRSISLSLRSLKQKGKGTLFS